MCSIGGVFSKKQKDIYPQLLDLLFSQKHRGKEGFGISIGNKIIKTKNLSSLKNNFFKGHFGICHSLLSVTGYSLQPIKSPNSENSFVHNGQIYNFKELCGKNFSNDSKACAFYFEKNFKKNVFSFMKKARGAYAFGVMDKKSLTAFRDPIGIKPIWWGENSEIFAFASEPQALKRINILFPAPLAPGHLIEFSKKGIFSKKVFDLTDFKKTIPKKSTNQNLFTSIKNFKFKRVCSIFFRRS